MKPYYDDGTCVIYHGDCREVLPRLGEVPDLVIADPPYGVGERTDRARAGRGKSPGRYQRASANDFPPVYGDDEPFDPTQMLSYRRVVLFGANHYADRLPPSPSWIVWDKLDGLTSKREVGFNDNADAELAWTNLGGPCRTFRVRWMGVLGKSAESDEPRLHPTQKPIGLMVRIIEWRTEPGDTVLEPYMGSGPVLVAAKQTNRRAIGIEIEERYCEIAAKRLAQEVLPFPVWSREVNAPCPFCATPVEWQEGWREWRGHCTGCKRWMYAPDESCARRTVCLPPPKTEWTRVVPVGAE